MTNQPCSTVPDPGEIVSLTRTTSELLPPLEAAKNVETQLSRMFRDPCVLQKSERVDLTEQLAKCVEMRPRVPELRVVLGMALCVDLRAQEALEVFREAVRLAPDNFVARLKFGELLMRLRICDQAELHTAEAAKLARNQVQSDLARQQAKMIRTMMREGIERGGYANIWSRITRLCRPSLRRSPGHAGAIMSTR